MAAHEKFDPRVDALVMETKTFWDPAVGPISEQDKAWLSAALHRDASKAAKVAYERSHTGFTREITVTVDDIARLYHEKFGS